MATTPALFYPLMGMALLFTAWACNNANRDNYEFEHLGARTAIELDAYLNADSIIDVITTKYKTHKQLDTLLALTELLRSYDGEVALTYARKAYDIATLKNRDFARGVSLYYMALIKRRQQEFGDGTEDALGDAQISRKIFNRLKSYKWLARIDNLIGILFYKQAELDPSKLDSARLYLNSALENIKKSSSSPLDSLAFVGEVFHDLGTTYRRIDTSKARMFFEESIANNKLAGNSSAMIRTQLVLGKILAEDKKLEEAEKLYLKSLDSSLLYKDNNNLIDVYGLLGKLEINRYRKNRKEDHFAKAIAYYNQQLTYQYENKYIGYRNIGLAYHRKAAYSGSFTDVDSAIVNYKKAIEFAQEEGALTTMKQVVDEVTVLCNERWRVKQVGCDSLIGSSAADFLTKNYLNIVDTITHSLQTANQKLVRFEREEVETKARQKRKNLLLISGIILIIAALIFLVLLQGQQQKRLRAQMEALRAQINPHFISNSLNAIENLVNMDQKEAAAKYLIHFSRLSRRILNGSREATTTLADELQTLEHFLALEQLRFRDKLNYEVQVSPGLNPGLVKIPAMILQPYVENAIWHGIKPKSGPGLLKVNVERVGKELVCTIEDDGIGRKKAGELKAASVLKQKSMGMKITQERIQIMGKVKGSQVQLQDLYDTQGQAMGTRVVIRLPFKLKKTPKTS